MIDKLYHFFKMLNVDDDCNALFILKR